jgi:predicted MPP superfamily phosphohydrolase
MKIKKTILFVPIVVIFFIMISCNTIKTRNYKLDSPLLVKHTSIKIILISDLHSTVFGKDQSLLLERIKKINPDLILLTGDIFDDVVPMGGTKLLLSGISGSVPIYYVTGNHEYWSYNIQEIKNELRINGINILSDSYENININGNEIILAGIEDPDKKYYEVPEYDQNIIMEETFRGLDEIKEYKILMAHRPENIEIYCKYSFDLVVSGHTHGGQVRIPYIMNGVYAPDQGFFPKYSGGLYRHGNLTHSISRGLSVNPKLPRIFNPPELVVIVIE